MLSYMYSTDSRVFLLETASNVLHSRITSDRVRPFFLDFFHLDSHFYENPPLDSPTTAPSSLLIDVERDPNEVSTETAQECSVESLESSQRRNFLGLGWIDHRDGCCVLLRPEWTGWEEVEGGVEDKREGQETG
jgi:hypothetical protein